MTIFNSQILLIQNLAQTPLGIFELVIAVMMRLCISIIFIAILINFIESRIQNKAKTQKNSIVETGTMIIFFIGFYLIIRSGNGVIRVENLNLEITLAVVGILIIILGTTFNILGRLALGQNWANQVTIYKDQTLVQTGVYNIVRHPLYASLTWMFFASSIIYLNWFALLVNLFVFIPFMTYRAKQEETLLSKEFPEYKKYQQKVGMFFPKIWR